jgi:hypothetical protein
MGPSKTCLTVIALLTGGLPVFGGDFNREVRPILSENCFQCHGPDEKARKAKLRLDDGSVSAEKLGELVLRIGSEDPDEIMPPPESKRSLDPTQISTLKDWVASGGPYAPHWAFVPPTRPAVPEAPHAVDHFIRSALGSRNLTPSPEAPRATQLRRLSLDLIGLPPTPAEVIAFENDPSPEAWTRTVDRLLASPRFGEKWARAWLDLARYADSNGFQADQLRESWAYRDWVIDALNADMPFDRFTIEQIAGDLLPEPSLAQRIATGFHRTVTCNVEAGVHPEENRVNQVLDRVNTSSTVWLGLTLECAQCHDHKFDPFSTRDYYRLFAFFNNTPLEVEAPSGVTDVQHNFIGPYLELPLSAEEESRRATLTQRIAAAKKAGAGGRSDVEWTVLPIAHFEGTGGEEFRVLDDGSLLLSGKVPDKTVYTLCLDNPLERITAFRLEVLRDPSLPGEGPGRGDPVRRNFVLHEFAARAASEAIGLHAAKAGFSQKGWDIGGAIDGDEATGWAIAPQFGKDHWATFETREPVTAKSLTVTLDQHFGNGRVLGRFRILATSEELTTPPRDRAPEAELASLKPTRTLVMQEMEESRATHILERGNYLAPGEAVSPGTPSILPPLSEEATPDRLALARWLVDRRNPLTARVTVNRWWAEIFGRGIVATLEDFGSQGEAPSHPELLDWLALEFMESGWSMKHVLREIVLSSTYRQSSKATSELREADPDNRWLARGPRFRLSAEAVRDNALAASGLLTDKSGGPPVMPYQPDGLWRAVGRNAPKWKAAQDEDRYRRGIYVVWRRAAPYPSFVNFDAPDRAACTVSRPRTNTPLQALTLLNDPAYVEMALALADRILREKPETDPFGRLDYAFRLVASRGPDPRERETLTTVLEERLAHFAANPALAAKAVGAPSFAYRPRWPQRNELAAWMHLANILLNLDETITKE